MKLKRPRKKTLFFLLLAFLVFSAIGLIGGIHYVKHQFFLERPSSVTFQGDLKSIPFQWSAASFGEHSETHFAMLIQVSIPDVANKFYMQFDTGSPYTFLRSGAIKALEEHGVDFELLQMDGKTFVKRFALHVGDNRVTLNSGHVHQRSSKIDLQDPDAINMLGTIGADFLDQNICAIDFPAQRIHLFRSRPLVIDSLGDFSPFSFTGRRVMLPTKIQDVAQHLFYDSGCSSFGLFTSKYHFDRLVDQNGDGISYNSSRHGDPIPIHHGTTEVVATFGSVVVPLKRVSYVEQYVGLQSALGRFLDGGVFGNEAMLESTLILDTKANEFLIVKRSIDDLTRPAGQEE